MKESFLLYGRFYSATKHLNLENKGRLFDAIFQYQLEGVDPHQDSPIYVAFMFMKNQFELDNIKYESIVERNKVNGSRGGRPRNSAEPKKPTGLSGFPEKPKKPDNDNEKDNDINNTFDAFWEIYPNKKSKHKAKLIWEKIKEDKVEIIEKLKRYKFSQDKQFIPHPTTWLNQKRWQDEQDTTVEEDPFKDVIF